MPLYNPISPYIHPYVPIYRHVSLYAPILTDCQSINIGCWAPKPYGPHTHGSRDPPPVLVNVPYGDYGGLYRSTGPNTDNWDPPKRRTPFIQRITYIQAVSALLPPAHSVRNEPTLSLCEEGPAADTVGVCAEQIRPQSVLLQE
ncbi:hypothetical protein XELAEV_18000402mg [Xenopus laevis]|uniref:Uncharacterized protein n=1 Tax=Xenopus laevis TaxID=8355 RepID=A0A974BPI5_XENLA|nr:hypothetical protein XELAEV_18000402mg [Xenopus laevis]